MGLTYSRPKGRSEVVCKNDCFDVPEVFCEKVVLKNFAKFTGNTCNGVSLLRKLPATLIKATKSDSGTAVLRLIFRNF